ncbi:hypothetical protein LC593_30735 [Nostoc sp. CHAB 5844]|nr:hypothetical protein [Nostoc sp. CHAB 5844]
MVCPNEWMLTKVKHRTNRSTGVSSLIFAFAAIAITHKHQFCLLLPHSD